MTSSAALCFGPSDDVHACGAALLSASVYLWLGCPLSGDCHCRGADLLSASALDLFFILQGFNLGFAPLLFLEVILKHPDL